MNRYEKIRGGLLLFVISQILGILYFFRGLIGTGETILALKYVTDFGGIVVAMCWIELLVRVLGTIASLQLVINGNKLGIIIFFIYRIVGVTTSIITAILLMFWRLENIMLFINIGVEIGILILWRGYFDSSPRVRKYFRPSLEHSR